MKQFKALMIKEWTTHRGTLLVPVWVTLALYGVSILGLVISLIKTGALTFSTAGMNQLPSAQLDLIAWYSVAGMVSLLGVLTVFLAMGISDGMLNGDRRKRCEIFHLSQPVSLLKIMAAKFAALFSGSMLVLLALVLFNSMVISAFMSHYMGSSFWVGIGGGLVAFLGGICSYLFAVSLVWFFSCVFRHKPILMALLIISGIEVSIHLLNYLVGWSIPSLWQYLAKLMNLTVRAAQVGGTKIQSVNLVTKGLDGIFNQDNLIRLVLTAVFLSGGYLFYKRREVV
jgi:ABC-type transport system involved in multi-copper enzyme maturation permease subunit